MIALMQIAAMMIGGIKLEAKMIDVKMIGAPLPEKLPCH
jgi:hypothetical protein